MPTENSIFSCDFPGCDEFYFTEPECEEHEKECDCNPENKECPSCDHYKSNFKKKEWEKHCGQCNDGEKWRKRI